MTKRNFDKLEEHVIAGLFVVATAVVILQAILKYILPDSVKIMEELSQYLYCYMAFMGIGYGMKYGADLSITLFGKLMKGPLKKGFQMFYNLLYVVLYAVLLFGSVQAVLEVAGTTGKASGIPLTFVYFSAVAGFALGLIRWVQKIIRKNMPMKEDAK